MNTHAVRVKKISAHDLPPAICRWLSDVLQTLPEIETNLLLHTNVWRMLAANIYIHTYIPCGTIRFTQKPFHTRCILHFFFLLKDVSCTWNNSTKRGQYCVSGFSSAQSGLLWVQWVREVVSYPFFLHQVAVHMECRPSLFSLAGRSSWISSSSSSSPFLPACSFQYATNFFRRATSFDETFLLGSFTIDRTLDAYLNDFHDWKTSSNWAF